jgi:hypothetical protein
MVASTNTSGAPRFSPSAEHLNDVPLDCRLGTALRESPRRLLQVANEMIQARAAYTDVVDTLPPLPESVFVCKRRKRERLEGPWQRLAGSKAQDGRRVVLDDSDSD